MPHGTLTLSLTLRSLSASTALKGTLQVIGFESAPRGTSAIPSRYATYPNHIPLIQSSLTGKVSLHTEKRTMNAGN